MVSVATAADDLSELYGVMPDSVRAGVSSTLAQWGASSAISAVDQIGPGAINAVRDLSSGNTVQGIEDAVPVVAAGMALVPGVGIAGAAILEGADFALTQIASWAGLIGAQTPYACDWQVGDVCFFGRSRPYGPRDANGAVNPSWLTLEKFASYGLKNAPNWHSHQSNNDDSWPELAWPDLFAVLGGALYALGDRVSIAIQWWLGPRGNQRTNPDADASRLPEAQFRGTPLGQFLLAYYRAWMRSLEFAINGYPLTGDFPLHLLKSAAAAWNAGRVSVPPAKLSAASVANDILGALGHGPSSAGRVDTWLNGSTTTPPMLVDEVLQGSPLLGMSAPQGQSVLVYAGPPKLIPKAPPKKKAPPMAINFSLPKIPVHLVGRAAKVLPFQLNLPPAQAAAITAHQVAAAAPTATPGLSTGAKWGIGAGAVTIAGLAAKVAGLF